MGSDRFVDREKATSELTKLGGEVVKPLAKSMASGDRELVSRGAYILRKLATSEDLDVSQEAYAALREMRTSKIRSVAAVSKKHVDSIHRDRQKRALTLLVEKGAVLNEDFVFVNPQGQAQPVRKLEIGDDWKGSENDLALLSWLYDIRHLSFRSEKTQGAWLKHAAKMESLESLAVRGGKVSDADLVAFLENREGRLRSLELKYIDVSDASVKAIGDGLADATSIKLYGTGITESGADRIRKSLPAVALDFRRGGFLGVGCQSHPLGCLISQVQAGTAASRAGFQAGDVIVRYDGEHVPSFEVLTKLISKNSVEDKVKIEVIRSAQTGEVEVRYQQAGDLGVSSAPDPLGVKITAIKEDSPLSRAARTRPPNFAPGRNPFNPFPISTLRKGDVIFRVNGEFIKKGDSRERRLSQGLPHRLERRLRAGQEVANRSRQGRGPESDRATGAKIGRRGYPYRPGIHSIRPRRQNDRPRRRIGIVGLNASPDE